jgi:Chaperone of endosialidase
MANLDFPASPAINAIYSAAGLQWRWDGAKWLAYTGGAGDIQGVTAGTGLNGGGTSGTVTLNLTIPVSVANGGTGSTTASGGLANLGGFPSTGGTVTGGLQVNGSIVISNAAWFQGRDTGGTPASLLTMWSDNNCYLSEASRPLHCRGSSISMEGRTTFDTRASFGDGFDIYGGTFYNGYSNGWLYFNGSLRVGDLISNGNLNSQGSIYVGGLRAYNNSSYFYFENSIHVNAVVSRNDVLVNGLQWYNYSGWMRTPNALWSNSEIHTQNNVTADNDIKAGGVHRGNGYKGCRVEQYGGDWDWISFAMGGGTLYVSPDLGNSGAWIIPGGWFSDARLKQNIRSTEIDALAAIRATPVRAFEWNDEGRKSMPWAAPEVAIGLVAQELEETMPAVVNVASLIGDGSMRYIADERITPYLVRAVQQLSAKLDELTARLGLLEGKAT